jgi:hypothetical protein
MKFTKPFYGVRAGEVYPTQFKAGEECPVELESSAVALGALEDDKRPEGKNPQGKALGGAPENKAA